MKVHMAYGTEGIEIEIDDNITAEVVKAAMETPLDDPKQAIVEACEKPLFCPPLRNLLAKRKDGKICIVISDSTRPVPSKLIIEALIEIFKEYKILDEDIQILIATGLHRKSTPKEMKQMLGNDIRFRFDIINHVAKDMDTLEYLGENKFGNPIYINKTYLEAEIKIITGYVEPHFFAGFSGGRKAIVPGIAGSETIAHNHCKENIGSEKARFGILKDNPIYEDAIDIAKKTEIKPDFMINVCINPAHQITKVIAGALQSHQELVMYQERLCFHPITERYDVVICGNGGFPLDLDLYQAVKSMAIGELGVKQGGTIITVNECRDGVGHPKFEEMINLGLTPTEFLEQLNSGKITCLDQWESQVLARVLEQFEVFIISSLPKDKLGNMGLKYATSVEEAVDLCLQHYGPQMRVLILPDGPMMLPKMQ
ncbi:nickel-dependent lactate racemase [Candidatus Lokiarchaeum ossiferum]|uniref:nickel-dependent lactate racemase n=1 Tax=Candidatus Lokiarchaeum ossiferum TaxID=2951803 RepID=UPI00352BFD02